MGCVYELHFPHGKIYVGKTVSTLSHRIGQHRSKANLGNGSVVHSAIRKYGWDSIKVLEVFNSDSNEELIKEEIERVRRYRQDGIKLYNITDGGEGVTGYKASPETIAKFRASRKGKASGEEHHNCKLTKIQVLEIFNLFSLDTPHTIIAEKYGVTKHAINDIRAGRSWSHLGIKMHSSPPGAARALSKKEVLEIRERLAQKCHQGDLAKEYGISPTTLTGIKQRKVYAWID